MAANVALSFERQVAILKQIADLADGTDDYGKKLFDHGYRSFLAVDEFERSFCAEGEYEIHSECRVERLKRSIESPDGIWLRRMDEFPIFDPCIERMCEIEISDNSKMESLRNALHEVFITYRKEELINIGVRSAESKFAKFAQLYFSAIADAFSRVGFEPDARRSKALFPVVSKPLNAEWDICWSPESSRTLRHNPLPMPCGDVRRMDHLDLRCYVCGRQRQGHVFIPIGFKYLDFMDIRVRSFQHGFGWAYMLYDSIEEFELVIGAHAFLYGLVSEPLERILRRELET